jgi:hypothetical protein
LEMGPSKVTLGDALACARDLRAPVQPVQLPRSKWMKRLLFGNPEPSASLVSMEAEEKSAPDGGRQGGQFGVSEFFPPLTVTSDAGLQL